MRPVRQTKLSATIFKILRRRGSICAASRAKENDSLYTQPVKRIYTTRADCGDGLHLLRHQANIRESGLNEIIHSFFPLSYLTRWRSTQFESLPLVVAKGRDVVACGP